MKKLTDINVNEIIQDAIIEYFMYPDRGMSGAIIWEDAPGCIAKCHGEAKTITAYIKDSDDYSKIIAIKISANSIKKLYKEILEIESQTSEEFID
jgi:hypothetical protein